MRRLGPQHPRRAPGLGGREQALTRIERFLRAAATIVELAGRGPIRVGEIVAEQAWHSAAEPVDRLVRVANHDQPRSRLGRGDEAQQLELRGVDVLELVDEDQLKLCAHPVAKRCTRLQQLDRARDEVAKVDQPRLLHAARDLARRAGGESEHEDLVPTGDALTHRLLVQIDECMRLAGARPGEHAKWSSYFMDVEWQQVSRSGAGDLIMPVRVSWSQPRLLTATRPR